MDKLFSQATKRSIKEPEKPEDQFSSQQQQQYGTSARGVVLGKDGKPCRTCTSSSDWLAMMKQSTGPSSSPSSSPPSTTTPTLPPDCPPDVDTLGNHTWTLLHSISANYPPRANPHQQSDMRTFLSIFSKIYPCWVCAEDFQDWMTRSGNEPRVEGRDGLGKWMCEAHNEVNRKLGKEEFDCGRWEERWRTGWKDGRCDE